VQNFLHKWVEQYLFFPNFFQQLISIILLPLTIIYCMINAFKRISIKHKFYVGIPVISIGNLIVGGSGKTPLTIALAKEKDNVCIVLRGYGRASKGLYIVSLNGEIKVDVNTSGDEAMLLAKSLPNASVIVCENRKEAILKAKEIGSKIIFLDDGFSKYNIEKFNILIRPAKEPTNVFCLPSGGYREPKVMYTEANAVFNENIDFKRVVTFKQNERTKEKLDENIVCLTAISKPYRLKEFLPTNTKIISFPDHHNFTQEELNKILNDYEDFEIITTQKDFVKLQKLQSNKNFIIMDLELQLHCEDKLNSMEAYIKKAHDFEKEISN
jgi:tetraacyldisaccharide 4'-kinase